MSHRQRESTRQLRESDRAALVALLEEQPATNLYMLGNLENLGFDAAICQFWGDFGKDGRLRGVINRYMEGWSIFGQPSADWSSLVSIMEAHAHAAKRLQDNPGGIATVLPWLRRYRSVKVSVEELMALAGDRFRPQPAPQQSLIRRATSADLEALVAFYANAGHMQRTRAAVARPLQATRSFIAEVDARIAAAALTNAETQTLAMIGGVYTPPSYRGRGLSQAVCSALCRDLLAAGKQPVLYWETPAAGAVYRKLGFVTTGTWRSVWLERVEGTG